MNFFSSFSIGANVTELERFRFYSLKTALALIFFISCVAAVLNAVNGAGTHFTIYKFTLFVLLVVYSAAAFVAGPESKLLNNSQRILTSLYLVYATYEYVFVPGMDYTMIYGPLVVAFYYASLSQQRETRIWAAIVSFSPLLGVVFSPENLMLLVRMLVINLISFALIDRLMSLYQLTMSKLEKSNSMLMQEKSRADQANNAKSDFLANMSHEIRTPLNGMFGSLQIIQQNKSDPVMVNKYTDMAMNSYQSVIGIVNDILDMTKITEGKVSLYPEPARLQDLLSSVCSDYAATARNKGIQLDGHMSDAAKQGNRLIDTLRLGQILRNLVSNALKFTDEGKIEIFIDIGKQANQVIISVKDTGVGIPTNKLDTIFEPFDQVDASRTTERRGTGLGLPITKRLVELMNGEISVSSTLGEGTTFTVTIDLPITQDKVKQDIAEQIADVKSARILLAEDVKTNQMVFEVMLQDEQYEIDMADDGEIAVEMALSGNYDVIFMDIMMPNMGGIEALQALKVAGFDRPIIACTANVMKDDVEQYLAAGFDGVIGKPYLRDELRMHIQSAVSSGNDVSSVNAHG